MIMNETTKLWHSKDERDWLTALDRYWDYVKDENLELERELIYRLDAALVKGFNEQRWYDFLRDKYFRWKYTAITMKDFWMWIIGIPSIWGNLRKPSKASTTSIFPRINSNRGSLLSY